jgi:hypothetical protein
MEEREEEQKWEQRTTEQQQAEQPGGAGQARQDREGEPDPTQVSIYQRVLIDV